MVKLSEAPARLSGARSRTMAAWYGSTFSSPVIAGWRASGSYWCEPAREAGGRGPQEADCGALDASGTRVPRHEHPYAARGWRRRVPDSYQNKSLAVQGVRRSEPVPGLLRRGASASYMSTYVVIDVRLHPPQNQRCACIDHSEDREPTWTSRSFGNTEPRGPKASAFWPSMPTAACYSSGEPRNSNWSTRSVSATRTPGRISRSAAKRFFVRELRRWPPYRWVGPQP